MRGESPSVSLTVDLGIRIHPALGIGLGQACYYIEIFVYGYFFICGGIVYGAGDDTPAKSSSICISLFRFSLDILICCQLSICLYSYIDLFISILNKK